jgi:hypothetical protein
LSSTLRDQFLNRELFDTFLAAEVLVERWRGHEPEIAIMGTAKLILAIAAVTIWSPWRDPR